jgi:hypothetical protein
MEAGKQNAQQNFDSRTVALLNRLASRRQNIPSTPGARPDSAKVDGGGTGGKIPQAGTRNAAPSPGLLRNPVDLTGKGSANQVQRPASAARIQHFQLQGKMSSSDRHGQAAAGGPPGVNGGFNIQGRLLNLQMNRDGSARAAGDPITPGNATNSPGFGARLGTPSGPKLGYAGAAGDDGGAGGSTGGDRVSASQSVNRLLRSSGDRGPGAHDDDDKGGVRRSVPNDHATGAGSGDQHARGGMGPDSAGSAGGVSANGPLVVCRSKDEKFANPERLNLDRRKLTSCPVLEGEERLRLLNYQNNFITKVPHLCMLDVYSSNCKRASTCPRTTPTPRPTSSSSISAATS